jgi:glycosyltransferase involved in cell wall biosynthesis
MHSIRLGNTIFKVHQSVHDCDLIYVPTGLKSFLYAYMCKGYRKLVAGPNITGIPLLMDPANPGPLMTTKMADAWIEMSELRVYWCMKAGTPRDRIHLVPHAIDVEKFHPRYASRDVWVAEGLNPEVKKIVHVGRMDEELKGFLQLIKTFNIIRQSIPETDLVFIGKTIPEVIGHYKHLERVHFVGPKYGDDLVRYLASSDLFLGTSRWETFWFTPLEAMACGLAVVVTNTGAVASMIPMDEVQGRIVPVIDEHTHQFTTDTAERLAQAVIPLLQDDAARHQMGKRAREHVIAEFSERKLGDRLVHVFKQTISGD